ncbi:MAG: T9SS type A sorting domain-containing protein [Flavobacteriales bacterium]|nr:T9SS type A sorting domain-containing protein [Flavobacteriales bacterium]
MTHTYRYFLSAVLSLGVIVHAIGQSGSNDPTFSIGTGFNSAETYIGVNDLALQPDGGVIVGGDFASFNGVTRNNIARLNPDGGLDTTFDPGSGFTGGGFLSWVSSLALQPDGRVIVGGDFTQVNGTPRNFIARLHPDGSLDTTFDPGSGFNMVIMAMALQPDGKVIVGGDFTSYNGTSCSYLVRLNADASLDTTFNTGIGFPNQSVVYTIAVQPNGKVLIGGAFTSYNGVPVSHLMRLMPDGTFDPTFNASCNDQVWSLVPQPNGKLLVGGAFTMVNGTGRGRIARLNVNGGLDPTFLPGTGFNAGVYGVVFDMALQQDGKIIASGRFYDYNGTSCHNIVRLLPNGIPDGSFATGAGFNDPLGQGVPALAIQPDGSVIVGGFFTLYDNDPSERIIRLLNDCLIGGPCDDGDSLSVNDMFTGECACVGTYSCEPSQLTTTADPVISCGATDLKFNGTSIIASTEVPGANKYQFLFTNVPGQPAYSRSIAKPSRSFILTKWYTLPLKAGRTYNVTVRASFDNGATWCAYGPSCTVKMSWFPLVPGQQPRSAEDTWADTPELLLYPNPTNGDNLRIGLSGVDPELTTVSLDITDLFGKRVMSSTLPINDGEVDAVLSLTGDLSSGLYIATITAGGATFNQRFVLDR